MHSVNFAAHPQRQCFAKDIESDYLEFGPWPGSSVP
jgi:hypothetical protein